MNNRNDQHLLDSMFEQARSNAPALDDSSFTQAVMSRLDQIMQQRNMVASAQYTNKAHRFGWVDGAGLCVGLVACFSVVDMPQLLALANSIVPDKVVLSPLTIIGASLTMSALAFSAWSALEGDLRS